jgi:hypothetical protein
VTDDQSLLAEALEFEAAAQRALLDGDEAAASTGFTQAAEAYRRSWEAAPPTAFGRLVGMLKATILSGEGIEEAADYARREIEDPTSPTAWYVCGIAAAVFGEDGVRRNAAEGMRAGGDAFGRAADALLALGDDAALDAAAAAIEADFAGREAHLTGVAIADTALMFRRLGALRGA